LTPPAAAGSFGGTERDRVIGGFQGIFGRRPQGRIRSPGRVNLIGEHTDYNDGFVLPIAIEPHVLADWAGRDDRTVRFRSLHAEPEIAVGLGEDLRPAPGAWHNYPVGVLAELARAGVELRGADVLFDSALPLGGGLSSSAALEVAAALALMAAAGTPRAIDGRELALLCQRAENHFAGAPCGIMDQSIVVMARPGRAMLLDCRSGEIRHVPFDDPGLVLLVADTQVKHDIGGRSPGGTTSPPGGHEGGYPLRRRQCHQAAEKLALPALRDASAGQLDRAAAEGRLDGDLLKRARHVVGEIARTLDAVEALEAGDYGRFGELMCASHASLRDDFEVSCEELDAIVEAARGCEGVYGARMTGGGFGGCAIILAEAGSAEAATEAIAAAFERRFGRRCPVFATRAAGGAGEAP
jgi:galactokinase